MNNERQPYLVVCSLPYRVDLKFGKSGAPAKQYIRPQFRRLGSEKCLSNSLQVVQYTPKSVTIELPESLACYGEGRYELVIHDKCCRVCDTVEIWFEADCEIRSATGEEIENTCDD